MLSSGFTTHMFAQFFFSPGVHVMRFKNLLFGITVSVLTIGSICSISWSQEQGKSGKSGGPGGDRGRGGPPGGFSSRGGGSSGIMGLLRMEEVQKELNVSEDQKKELTALTDRLRESFGSNRGPGGTTGGGGRPDSGRPDSGRPDSGRPDSGRPDGGGRQGGQFSPEQMKEMMAKMAEFRDKAESEVMSAILDPEQGDRILGLLIQNEDGRALTSKPVADVVGLTSDQKQQLVTISEKFSAERMKMMQTAFQGGGGPSQEMRDQMEAHSTKMNSELLAVMSPEQKAKFESMKGAKFTFPEPRGFGGPGGGDRGRGGPSGEGGRPARPESPGT